MPLNLFIKTLRQITGYNLGPTVERSRLDYCGWGAFLLKRQSFFDAIRLFLRDIRKLELNEKIILKAYSRLVSISIRVRFLKILLGVLHDLEVS